MLSAIRIKTENESHPSIFFCLIELVGGPAHEIVTKTVHKTLFCQSKTSPCAVFSIQISSKSTGEVDPSLFPPLHISTCVFSVNVVNCSGF